MGKSVLVYIIFNISYHVQSIQKYWKKYVSIYLKKEEMQKTIIRTSHVFYESPKVHKHTRTGTYSLVHNNTGHKIWKLIALATPTHMPTTAAVPFLRTKGT